MGALPSLREGRGARVALAVGLALLGIAVVARLSRPPLVIAGTNSVADAGVIAIIDDQTTACQANELLPAGTTAIRPWVKANLGPRATVTVTAGSVVVARGSQSAGWTGDQITIAIGRVPRTIPHAKVCLTFGAPVEAIGLVGALISTRGGREAKMRVEYLRPGRRSWWSLASSVAHQMGLGRMPSGTWIAFIPLALMAGAVVLSSWLVLSQLGFPARRAKSGVRVALACAGVACLSAASWSIITPPFQAPDEPAHFAYAQQLAETGTLPKASESISLEETVALEDLDHYAIMFNPTQGTISSTVAQQRLEHDLSEPLSRRGAGAGVAASEPPLYYALQTVPYLLASQGSLLERLALMRLLSVAMAGLATFFTFLFIREALPRVPWAWTVGGLGVALFPLLGFMSGVVNPDSMLCAVSAALLYCLARAFRRGLTPRLAVAIGVVTAVGLLTKLNFVGLVPGVILALTILTLRAVREDGRSAYRLPAVAVAIGGCPVYLYLLIGAFSHHALLSSTSTDIATASNSKSVLGELTYIWQFYLPRLPGMSRDFPGVSPLRAIWFDRVVGLYGWLDTYFPSWVYDVALIAAGLIVALCLRALAGSRASLRGRLSELVVYAVMGIGILALVGADSYVLFPSRAGAYAEPRYLLPMAALFGAILTLAARGAGRRWGPALGALIVVLILGHDIFSQLLTISRYYS
jgi:hypothetical protein